MRKGRATQCYKCCFANSLKLKSYCCTMKQIVGFCTGTDHGKGTYMSLIISVSEPLCISEMFVP